MSAAAAMFAVTTVGQSGAVESVDKFAITLLPSGDQ